MTPKTSQISKNKTVITIAHKFSTIIDADRIIFIQDGQIVESGTHKELMEQNSFYQKMYEAKTDGK